MVGSTRTSNSSSAMLSSYAVAIGMVRSTIPSMIACITMLASPLLRRTVSEDCRRFSIGSSITSAECSKNETRVLSLWRKSDTCSTETMRPFGARVLCSSIYLVLSSFGSWRYACSVLTFSWYSTGTCLSWYAGLCMLTCLGRNGAGPTPSLSVRISRCRVKSTNTISACYFEPNIDKQKTYRTHAPGTSPLLCDSWYAKDLQWQDCATSALPQAYVRRPGLDHLQST